MTAGVVSDAGHRFNTETQASMSTRIRIGVEASVGVRYSGHGRPVDRPTPN
jgi:hypothetical protein